MRKYRDLNIWQKGRELVKELYKITESFPNSEKYNLIDQIRRAAVSVPTNIAEGSGRDSNKELNRFLDIASGSLYEIETLLIISSDLGYWTEDDMLFDKIDHLEKMIFKFKQSLKI